MVVERPRKGLERLPFVGEKLFALHEALSVSTQFIYEHGTTNTPSDSHGKLLGRFGYDRMGFLIRGEIRSVSRDQSLSHIPGKLIGVFEFVQGGHKGRFTIQENHKNIYLKLKNNDPVENKPFPSGLTHLPQVLLNSIVGK